MSTPVRRALYGKLAGDTPLTTMLGVAAPGFTQSIYHNQAPQEAVFPFVVFSKSSGRPTEAFHDPSAYETDMWLIKAIDLSTSADTAEAIAARFITLLNDAALSISGGTLLYLRRESDVEYQELSQGEHYQHVGAMFRVITEF